MAKREDRLRVCYFGTYSRGEEYARNNAIISGLEKNGVEVITCQTDVWPTHQQKMEGLSKGMAAQAWAFARAYLRLAGKYARTPEHDIVFVGYVGHIDAFPARVLAWLRRKPVAFDAFYSLYDTVVLDRGLFPAASMRARIMRMIDRWSCRLSDMVLLDTWEHVDYFCREFGLDKSKFLAVPLGTDEKNFFPRPWPEEDGILDCISYSSYIPLHGIDVQLEAAGRLRGIKDVRFTFVGKGQLYPEMRKKAQEKNLANVQFIEWLPHGQLVEKIAEADVCLGIFGLTEKASRVVPYKVYEALAMRKPVITGDSPAARSLLRDGEHALLSPMGDAQKLAEKIVALKDDEQLTRKIAQRGHELFKRKCTSEAIGRTILAELSKRWGYMAPCSREKTK